MTYDAYFPGWRLALAPGVAAHVVAERALDLPDGPSPGGFRRRPTSDPATAEAAMAAKAALVSAIVGRDADELADLSRFWNTAYNLTELPDDPALLVSSGPTWSPTSSTTSRSP